MPYSILLSMKKRHKTAYWLLKTEPESYSIDDLKNQKVGRWDGVRNFQARNFLRSMTVGDTILIYHSSTKETGIYGIGEVKSAPYPDPTQFDRKSPYFDAKSKVLNPLWTARDIKFIKKLKKPLLLKEIKEKPQLESMVLVKPGSRLSVQPVTPQEYRAIVWLLKAKKAL